jgi:hypothetical protein
MTKLVILRVGNGELFSQSLQVSSARLADWLASIPCLTAHPEEPRCFGRLLPKVSLGTPICSTWTLRLRRSEADTAYVNICKRLQWGLMSFDWDNEIMQSMGWK